MVCRGRVRSIDWLARSLSEPRAAGIPGIGDDVPRGIGVVEHICCGRVWWCITCALSFVILLAPVCSTISLVAVAVAVAVVEFEF